MDFSHLDFAGHRQVEHNPILLLDVEEQEIGEFIRRGEELRVIDAHDPHPQSSRSHIHDK